MLEYAIVDDERLARTAIRRQADGIPDLEFVGEADGVESGVDLIRRAHPRLLFLDIQMQDGTGFDLLERIADHPAIIFVTAHGEHAVRAFDMNAVDYLLKPVQRDRMQKAVQRAARWLAGIDRQEWADLPLLRADDLALLQVGSSGMFTPVEEIYVVESNGNYSNVYTADNGVHLVRQSMQEWEARLPPDLFTRLDRSLLVNQQQIKHASASSTSASFTIGSGEHSFQLGRAGANRLRKLLDG